MFFRRIFPAVLLACLACTAVSSSCEWCIGGRGSPLATRYDRAMTIILIHVEPGAVQANGDGSFSTQVSIDQIIKDHEFLKGKKSVTLKRRLDPNKSQQLLFCDVTKDRIEPFEVVDVAPKSELIKYFEGAIALKDRPIGERLRYYFDYLNSSELEIASDAYREFALADYKDYRALAKTLPAEKIAGWLADAKTPTFRYGLYGSLLGHCGTKEHAKVIRTKIDEAIKNQWPELGGLLAGYIMLEPTEAWNLIRKTLGDDKESFNVRNACVQTADFVRRQRSDLLPAKELSAVVAVTLVTPTMADIGIDFLRRAKAWDRTAEVLALSGKKTADMDFDNRFIKRAILRFALTSPEPSAAAFVKEMRRRDAEEVRVTEEILQVEELLLQK